MASLTELLERIDDTLVQLLDHHFGDGLVYLRDPDERGHLERAKELGLVNAEGYLTPAGRSVLAQFGLA